MIPGIVAGRPVIGGGGGGSDPYWPNVVSLLHFNGSSGSTTFTDETGKAWSALGAAQIDTSQSVFGGASGLFNGTNARITTPNHSSLNFGTNDATVEFWMRPSSVSGNAVVAGKISGAAGSWIIFRSGTNLQLYVSSVGSGGGIWDMVNAALFGTVAAGSWYHVAWVRSGSTFMTFLDGVPGATGTSSASIFSGSQVAVVGANPGGAGGDFYAGHIDEMRWTNGVARYTSSFTPPTAPFPDW